MGCGVRGQLFKVLFFSIGLSAFCVNAFGVAADFDDDYQLKYFWGGIQHDSEKDTFTAIKSRIAEGAGITCGYRHKNFIEFFREFAAFGDDVIHGWKSESSGSGSLDWVVYLAINYLKNYPVAAAQLCSDIDLNDPSKIYFFPSEIVDKQVARIEMIRNLNKDKLSYSINSDFLYRMFFLAKALPEFVGQGYEFVKEVFGTTYVHMEHQVHFILPNSMISGAYKSFFVTWTVALDSSENEELEAGYLSTIKSVKHLTETYGKMRELELRHPAMGRSKPINLNEFISMEKMLSSKITNGFSESIKSCRDGDVHFFSSDLFDGDLAILCDRNCRYNFEYIVLECLRQLSQMHGAGIVHNDIGLRNIFFSFNEKREVSDVAISDFDYIKTIDNIEKNRTDVYGTVYATQPHRCNLVVREVEAGKGCRWTFKQAKAADVFALGVALLELLDYRDNLIGIGSFLKLQFDCAESLRDIWSQGFVDLEQGNYVLGDFFGRYRKYHRNIMARYDNSPVVTLLLTMMAPFSDDSPHISAQEAYKRAQTIFSARR